MQKSYRIDERASQQEVTKLKKFLGRGGDAQNLSSPLAKIFEPVDEAGFFALKEKPVTSFKYRKNSPSEPLKEGICIEIKKDEKFSEFLKEFDNWAKECSSSTENHFREVIGSVSTILGFLVYFIKTSDATVAVDEIKQAEELILWATVYRKLIESFPQFKESELAGFEGHFPEVKDANALEKGVINYIKYASKQLTTDGR